MKKNRVMRFASVILILTLLSTSVISGTFAKYVTTAETGDTARVAKWGITIGKADDEVMLFDTQYKNGDAVTVDAAENVDGTYDNLVAPGTSGTADYTIMGTPETDYIISFDYTEDDVKDVYLGAGTYTYEDEDGKVTYADTMKCELTDDYYPIKYTVTIATTNGTVGGEGELSDSVKTYDYDKLADALADLKKTTISFDANEACDVNVQIDWAWAFTGQNDKADTVLGDLMAEVRGGAVDLVVPTGATNCLDIVYNLTIVVTQVD